MQKTVNPYTDRQHIGGFYSWWEWGYQTEAGIETWVAPDKGVYAKKYGRNSPHYVAWDKGRAAAIKDRLSAKAEKKRASSCLSGLSDKEAADYVQEVARDAELVDLTEPSAAPVTVENPKDAVGSLKASMSAVPTVVLAELGVAMMEGARKYGRHNYRAADIRASIYFDAVMRHMMAWFEGEDIDPDSGLSHVTKAIASLVVLRDGQINENIIDDRPPPAKEGWMAELNKKASALADKYPNPKDPVTR